MDQLYIYDATEVWIIRLLNFSYLTLKNMFLVFRLIIQVIPRTPMMMVQHIEYSVLVTYLKPTWASKAWASPPSPQLAPSSRRA